MSDSTVVCGNVWRSLFKTISVCALNNVNKRTKKNLYKYEKIASRNLRKPSGRYCYRRHFKFPKERWH